jgi:hypothetical protein
MVMILQQPDNEVDSVAKVLGEFEQTHSAAKSYVYRYNPGSIRVKIVDSVFHGRSKGERHDYALRFLNRLPDDVMSQVSVLLCLAPGESSMMDLEFDSPTRTQL